MNRFPACLVTLAASTLLAFAAHADPIGGVGWNQVFNDDFNGTAVDETLWTYRTDVKSYSTQLPDNVSVADGVMNIALRQQTVGSTNYTGGGLVSRQRFRYGYYETRVRINDGAGWHTAFWLQAGDGSTTFPSDQRTEIDGFEIESASPTWLRHNILTWKGNGVSVYYKSTNPYNIGMDLREWHVYGIDWEENDVKFYVDSVLEADFPYSPGQWTHDFTAIWLTSIAYPSAPDATKLPSTVQFDYARYWQKDYYVDNDGPASAGYSETGAWLDSSLTGWTYGSTTRYAACGVAGATATWRPTLASAGTYQVFVYNIVHSASDPAARYDVAGSTTVVNGTMGSKGWLSLGTFAMPAGNGTAVQLTSSGTGCARADAVKFVRVS